MAETSSPSAKSTKSPNQRGVSWFLLLGFIVASLTLIGLTWRENLVATEPATPGYYRDTFVIDESVYATVTAEAAAAEAAATPTP